MPDLLLGVFGCDEEPESRRAFRHRRVENRPRVDTVLEQRGRDLDTSQRVAQDDGNDGSDQPGVERYDVDVLRFVQQNAPTRNRRP